MSIFEALKAALLESRKARNTETTATLNTFLEGMRSDIMGDLSMAMYGIYSPEDTVVTRYLKNTIKVSKAAVVEASKANTESSANFVTKTNAEIALLETFLPKQLSDHELGIAVGQILSGADSSLSGGKLMGYVMSHLKAQYEGLFDATKVKGLLEAK